MILHLYSTQVREAVRDGHWATEALAAWLDSQAYRKIARTMVSENWKRRKLKSELQGSFWLKKRRQMPGYSLSLITN
jgi:hypothetical protein